MNRVTRKAERSSMSNQTTRHLEACPAVCLRLPDAELMLLADIRKFHTSMALTAVPLPSSFRSLWIWAVRAWYLAIAVWARNVACAVH